MFFKQFYLQGLGHASYLIASEQTGEGLVFDPRRDVDPYLAEARAQGLRLRYALDSHGHNDYLSGVTQLTVQAGVEALGSAEAGLGYPHRPLRDGEVIDLGEVRIEVLHTPGHTPEHLSLLVYDRSASDGEPALFLSGGALLVGDLARPDLLGGTGQAREAASAFYQTLCKKVLPLPDHVEVFPTHVAGSLCGGHIGSRLSTTVGYERRTNPILSVTSEAEFVDAALRTGQLPAVPPYWRSMRRQNFAGVSPLGVLSEPPALRIPAFEAAVADGAVVVDTRDPAAFGGGHIPGALSVGLGPNFATWAGTVVPEDRPVLLVLDHPSDLWPAVWDLLRIGYGLPEGWLSGGMPAWRNAAQELEFLDQITVHELRRRLEWGEVGLLDVRQPAEWMAGRVAGAAFLTGGELPSHLEEVPDGDPLAVICGSGYRSSVISSLLAGVPRAAVPGTSRHLLNVAGGMSAWRSAGYPTVGDATSADGR
ncbi:MAG: MBL fold metallo-hydrolase [Acidimicrobiia bacterium]